ncbi:MAG TPA: polysaccharide deacetylase family protein [Candidatus Baltobacteraceae bacterium]|nr:polysaccharide deacetylase family protein [Candidatus Baltobacteraceae bacterium]
MTFGARVAMQTLVACAAMALLGFWFYEFSESPSNQIFGRTLVSGPRDQRVVALTFDDGPNPPYTSAILDVLEKERVHATFFVVGRAVAAYPAVVRREVRDGDAIGNHTWSHGHLIWMDAARVRTSLARTDEAIYRAAGVRPRIMRPPFGARDWLVLDEVRRMGYTPVMWSVPLANDWEQPPPQTIADRIVPYVRDGSIVVLHDGNRGIVCGGRIPAKTCDRHTDIEATQLIIDRLRREGFRFVTVPELLARGGATHIRARGIE